MVLLLVNQISDPCIPLLTHITQSSKPVNSLFTLLENGMKTKTVVKWLMHIAFELRLRK